MVKRIDALTAEQTARMPEWRDRWIAIGLSTERADRARFERAIPACYAAANLPPPQRVVWVSSPFVMALAAPMAGHLLGKGASLRGAVHYAVRGAVDIAVGDAVGGAVRGAVDGAVRGAVDGAAAHGAVHGAVRDAVSAVGDAVDGAVHGAVGDAVGASVRGAVDIAVAHGAVRDAVRDAVSGAVHGAVYEAVRDAVRDAVGDAVHNAVHGAVGAVRDAVGDGDGAVRDAVDEIRKNWFKYLGGQFWVGGWYWGSPAYVSFFREVCGLDLGDDMAFRAQAYEDTATSAGWWWPHTDFVMAVERPTHIDRDAQGRLHSETRAAIAWPDGWGVYSWHGVRVPAWMIEHPEQITAEQIDQEPNAEIRRVMIARFGLDRYAASGEHLDADEDQFGRPRRLVRRRFNDGSPDLVMVLVKNSTPEPDGSIKDYALCVHPEIRPMYTDGKLGPKQKATCRNAVASLAGKRGDDYAPQVET
jgi:hypothetical protein